MMVSPIQAPQEYLPSSIGFPCDKKPAPINAERMPTSAKEEPSCAGLPLAQNKLTQGAALLNDRAWQGFKCFAGLGGFGLL